MNNAGFARVIKALLAEDTLVYGGFSAGAVVAGPTLRGIDIMDNPNLVPDNYGPVIIWDGLGLELCGMIPHFRSLYPKANLADQAAQYLADNRLNFKTMKAGDVIIRENNLSRYLSATDIQ